VLWVFPQTGFSNDMGCDAWNYFGLFANPAYIHNLPYQYQVSRVPLYLPGLIFIVVIWSALSKNRLASAKVLLVLCILFFGLSQSNSVAAVFFAANSRVPGDGFAGDWPAVRAGYSRVKVGINFIRDNYHGTFPNFWLANIPGADDVTWLVRSFVRAMPDGDRLPDPNVLWQQSLSESDGLIIISGEPTLHQDARA
jgi:hypothetical protein